jgi:hypothetical protein
MGNFSILVSSLMASFRTALAMLILMLFALLGAGFANVDAGLQDLRNKARTTTDE